MPGDSVTRFQKRGPGDKLPRKNQAVMHLIVCQFCGRFLTQTRMIGEQGDQLRICTFPGRRSGNRMKG